MPVRILPTEHWREAYPGAMVGILAVHGLVNPELDDALQDRARELQAQIRVRFEGFDRPQLVAIPTLQIYARYYKRFGKTYHVQLQLESVLFKEKAIAGPSAIVQSMFMAELKNQMLTAGHDLEAVQGDMAIDVALGTEGYTLLSGGEQTLKAGDMYIRDKSDILSSIIYGPDRRTRIRAETRAAVFTVYAPPGIPQVELETHLSDLEANVRVFSPRVAIETREILTAD